MSEDCDDVVLARLPNGARIASSLMLDQSPPRHLYRVLSAEGTVLSEHATLVDLSASLESGPPLRTRAVLRHG